MVVDSGIAFKPMPRIKNMKPKVVIVAGGLATRMKPVSEEIPKCMIPIKGKPLIQRQIEFFRGVGYSDFIFCVANMSDKVKEYFGDGSSFGVKISYSEERGRLLGTAGSVKLAEPALKDTFIVYYGDNLSTEDFDMALDFHIKKKSGFTVFVRELPHGYMSSSIIDMDRDSRIKAFLEKPPEREFRKRAGEKSFINNGIYIAEPRVLREIPAKRKYDFAKQLIPKLIGKKMKVYGYVTSGFYREIGTLEKYEKAKKELAG